MTTESARTHARMLESIKDLTYTYDEKQFKKIMWDMFRNSLHEPGDYVLEQADLYNHLIELHKLMCKFSKSANK